MPTTRGATPRTLPVLDLLGGTARKLKRTLQGKENFTGLLVSEQNVKPFLDKTDGEKLIEPSGLDTGVVETPAIAVEAVTSSDYVFNLAAVDCNSETPTVVGTLTVTLLAGEAARVEGNCTVYTSSTGTPTGTRSANGIISVFRDGVEIAETVRGAASIILGVDLLASATTLFTDEPGAGTFTYTLRAYADNNVGGSYDISHCYLGVTRVKR